MNKTLLKTGTFKLFARESNFDHKLLTAYIS